MLYKVSCHCGSVQLEVETDLSMIKQCNCSICKRKNAKMSILPKEAIKSIKGEDNLSVYQFGTKVAKHYFCKICGIYTHHNPRRDPSLYGFNVACLENVNPYDLKDIPLVDGANHPLDKKK